MSIAEIKKYIVKQTLTDLSNADSNFGINNPSDPHYTPYVSLQLALRALMTLNKCFKDTKDFDCVIASAKVTLLIADYDKLTYKKLHKVAIEVTKGLIKYGNLNNNDVAYITTLIK